MKEPRTACRTEARPLLTRLSGATPTHDIHHVITSALRCISVPNADVRWAPQTEQVPTASPETAEEINPSIIPASLPAGPPYMYKCIIHLNAYIK